MRAVQTDAAHAPEKRHLHRKQSRRTMACLAAASTAAGALTGGIPQGALRKVSHQAVAPRALIEVSAEEFLSTLPIVGDYPVLVALGSGFLFACILFWKCRSPPPTKQPEQEERQERHERQWTPNFQQEQMQPVQMQPVPMQHMQVHQRSIVPYASPNAQGCGMVPVGMQMTPVAQRELMTDDMKALVERSRHEELVAEGVASMKRVFYDQNYSIAGRMGLMTASKVIEIERMLVQDMEDSLIAKVGFVANLFHSWRSEVSILRVGRHFEEQFDRQKGDWEQYLTDQRRHNEKRLHDTARRAAEQHARWRQAAGLMLDQWAHGNVQGLARTSLRAWRDAVAEKRAKQVQRQRVHSVLAGWVEGTRKGSMHICLKNWHQYVTTLAEMKKKQAELDGAKSAWAHFLDEQAAENESKLDSAAEALRRRSDRARKEVELMLRKWELGSRMGVGILVMQSWAQAAKMIRRMRTQQAAVKQAVLQFVSGRDAGTAQGCFISWKNRTAHEMALVKERKKWDDILTGDRARREEEDNVRMDAEKQRKEQAREAVHLLICKFQLGDTLGLKTDIFAVWRAFALKRGMTLRKREDVHSSILKWLEGDKWGEAHNCFIHWKASAAQGGAGRKHQAELAAEKARWDQLLSDERHKYETAVNDHRSDHEKRTEVAKAVVQYTLARWELGDDTGTVKQILLAWQASAREAKRLGRKRQAVHLALMRALEGETRALLHASLMNWRHQAHHDAQQRHGESRMADEKSRWQTYLDDQKKAHQDLLDEKLSEEEARRQRAHYATELMLRQWSQGNDTGLLATIMKEWHRLNEQQAALAWRRQAVHDSVVRFCEGDGRGTVHICFLNWRHWAKTEAIYKEEVFERDRKITKLEERWRTMLGREQSRLLKYARMLGSSDDPVMLVMVVAAWRFEAMGVKANETKRKMEVALEEQRARHDIAVTKRRRMSAVAIEMMGFKDKHAIQLDLFLAWVYDYQVEKQAWKHKLTHSTMVTKYSWYVQCQFFKQDSTQILTACFWELLREAKHQLHVRQRQEQQIQIDEAMETMIRFQDERASLEEELRMAYRQIDNITDTLQKELKTKEELASELRDVYDSMRKKNSSAPRACVPTKRPQTPVSPQSVDSELPHLPASVLGIPGSAALNLESSLVTHINRSTHINRGSPPPSR